MTHIGTGIRNPDGRKVWNLNVYSASSTIKGQVTIPRNVRESLCIKPESEIDFIEDNGKFYIIKTGETAITGELKKSRGVATSRMSTDEIMHLTREL